MEAFAYLMARGVQPDGFWAMSMGEIRAVMDAMDAREQTEYRLNAALLWRSAALVGTAVNSYWEKKIKYPALDKAFPDMGAREAKEGWEALRERMSARAVQINRRKGGEALV